MTTAVKKSTTVAPKVNSTDYYYAKSFSIAYVNWEINRLEDRMLVTIKSAKK